VIVAGIVPHFVCPALARHDLDSAAIAIVHDQRVRAAAAESKLVIRPDRQARSSATIGRSSDREDFLDMERRPLRNPEGDAGAAAGSAGRRDVEIEFSIPGIEDTLLDAIGEYVVSIRVRAVEPDPLQDFEAVFSDEGDEVVQGRPQPSASPRLMRRPGPRLEAVRHPQRRASPGPTEQRNSDCCRDCTRVHRFRPRPSRP